MSYISALKKEHKARKLRKQGYSASVVTAIERQPAELKPSLFNTIEGCVLSNLSDKYFHDVKAEFDKLPLADRRAMEYDPQKGGWIARAQLWKELLYCALGNQAGAEAMQALLRWYRRCVVMRAAQ